MHWYISVFYCKFITNLITLQMFRLFGGHCFPCPFQIQVCNMWIPETSTQPNTTKTLRHNRSRGWSAALFVKDASTLAKAQFSLLTTTPRHTSWSSRHCKMCQIEHHQRRKAWAEIDWPRLNQQFHLWAKWFWASLPALCSKVSTRRKSGACAKWVWQHRKDSAREFIPPHTWGSVIAASHSPLFSWTSPWRTSQSE